MDLLVVELSAASAPGRYPVCRHDGHGVVNGDKRPAKGVAPHRRTPRLPPMRGRFRANDASLGLKPVNRWAN